MQPVGSRAALGVAVAAALVATAGCAHGGRAARVEGHAFVYHDDQGLDVVTVAGAAAQPIPGAGVASAEVTVDDIAQTPIDAVSSASIGASGDGSVNERRVEVGLGYAQAVGAKAAPIELRVAGRFSAEPDYTSASGELGVEVPFAERTTVLDAFVGYGRDTVAPTSVPAGDEGRWPASHDRWGVGLALDQVLSPRLDLTVSASLARQAGALSSPYRRALVRSGVGFFADWRPEGERHPDLRLRGVAEVALAAYLGAGFALHVRIGGYADDWGVLAVEPAVEGFLELGGRVLLGVGYRFLAQSAASFYADRYPASAATRTGDRRLGGLDAQAPSLELRWIPIGVRDHAGALELRLAWEPSWLTYRGPDPDLVVLAHVVALGLALAY